MRNIRLAAIFIFLAALAGTVVVFNANKPRLLILQSYDKEYSWTRDVDVGIHRGLSGNREYSVRWFYMDTKRHPWKEYKVNAGRAAQKLIRTWQPTVVIAVDDDAQQYAMRNFVNQPQIKIVYSGVNGEPQDFGYDKANNVTGILERKPFAALRETLLQIASDQHRARPLRILFLGDASESVRQDGAAFAKFDWGPIAIAGQQFAATFDDWKAAVEYAAKHQVDFIITANYRKIARKKGEKALVPYREVIQWTEAYSRVPLIGTNAFYVEDGGMLAIATSPYEQGEVATGMALQLLRNGKSVQDLPVQATQQFVIAMRASSMKKWGIQLPAVYEAAARASANYYP